MYFLLTKRMSPRSSGYGQSKEVMIVRGVHGAGLVLCERTCGDVQASLHIAAIPADNYFDDITVNASN